MSDPLESEGSEPLSLELELGVAAAGVAAAAAGAALASAVDGASDFGLSVAAGFDE